MKNVKSTTLCALLALALIFPLKPMLAQAATPFTSVAPTVPPAIGQPGVSLAWDTTNKNLVVTFSVANAANTATTVTTMAYNPRLIEGINAGGVNLGMGGVTVLLKHNLATDPLTYQIGTATAVLATCSTVTPLPTGATACPTIPW